LAAVVVLLAACGPRRMPIDLTPYVWPPSPLEPKIKLIRLIATDLDIRTPSTLEKLFGEESTMSFGKPHGIAVDKEGNIYVSDSYSRRVHVLNIEKQSIGELVNAYGWDVPLGVAVDDKNELVAVADAGANKVYIFDRRSRSIERIIGGEGGFRNPVGVAFDPDRKIIYINDSKIHEVHSYTLDGKFISKVAYAGAGVGDVYHPALMDTDNEGKLYVVDTMNFRLQIFDPTGGPTVAFGEHGDRPGMFARPKGVAVSDDGYVFVTDAAFGNFQIFDKNGMAYLYVGSPGRAPGRFNIPQGIAVDSKDRVFVVDQINKRVQVFQYLSERYKQSMSLEPAPAPAAGPKPQ